MNQRKNHIDELFNHELGNFEVIPSNDVWLNIEKKLNKRKKARILYFRLGFAAGFTLLIGFSGLFFLHKQKPSNDIVIVKKEFRNDSNLVVSKNEKPTDNNKSSQESVNNNSKTSTPSKKEDISINQIQQNDFIVAVNQAQDIISGTPENENSDNETRNDENLTFLMPKFALLQNTIKNTILVFNSTTNNIDKTSESQIAANELKPRINRWSIEGQVAPIYAYRNITSTSANIPDKSEFNQSEDGMFSYSNALKISYKASNKIHFQFGVSYSVLGQIVKNIYVQQPADNLNVEYSVKNNSNALVNSSLGMINKGNVKLNNNYKPVSSTQYAYFNQVGDVNRDAQIGFYSGNNNITSPNRVNIQQHIKVIEIPVLTKYSLINKKFVVYLVGGASINILVGNEAIVKYEGETENIGETSDLKTFSYVGVLGTGLGYKVKQNITIHLEPTFKYFINSISKNADIKVHPYSFGIFTGISYDL